MATMVTARGLAATVTTISGGPANLKSVVVTNSSAAVAFIQLFNKATPSAVALGTTLPDLTIEVGIGATVTVALPGDAALLFGLGIQAASTTTDGGASGSAAGVELTVGVA